MAATKLDNAAAREILIVEDNEDVQELTAELVESAGYRAVVASNGREALDYLAHHRPDLILLDLMMPVMSGAEFREAQLARPELADIPVVVLSAAYASSPRSWAGVPMLRKPVDIDTLLATIARLC